MKSQTIHMVNPSMALRHSSLNNWSFKITNILTEATPFQAAFRSARARSFSSRKSDHPSFSKIVDLKKFYEVMKKNDFQTASSKEA